MERKNGNGWTDLLKPYNRVYIVYFENGLILRLGYWILMFLNLGYWDFELEYWPCFLGILKNSYVLMDIDKYERSLYTQLRLGILPLEIEIGRYKGIELNNRICQLCNLNKIESEIHFVTECTAYLDERRILYNKCNVKLNETCDKIFEFLMSDINIKPMLLYIKNSYKKRQQCIYVKK